MFAPEESESSEESYILLPDEEEPRNVDKYHEGLVHTEKFTGDEPADKVVRLLSNEQMRLLRQDFEEVEK